RRRAASTRIARSPTSWTAWRRACCVTWVSERENVCYRIAGRPRSPGYPDGVSSRPRVHPDVRIARGCLLAVTSAVLSVTAHTVADGALPPLSVALVIAG